MKKTWIGVAHCGHFWARALHCARGWGQSVGTGLLLRLLLLTLAATASLPARANIAVGSSGQAASYTDGGINGPLGVGWSLQGISTITRCGSARPIDGVARAVDFSGDDKLCLDSQRLIQAKDTGEVFPAAVYDINGKFASFPQVGDDQEMLNNSVRILLA